MPKMPVSLMRWVLLAGLTWGCPVLAQPAPSDTVHVPAARNRVMLCLRVALSPEERAVLGNLLAPEFQRRGLTLVVESSALAMRAWVARHGADAGVLLLADLSLSSSNSWRLTIVDAVRGRAIARALPGGAHANAAVLEAVASILSSAASALSDGLEVASQSIDEVVAAPVIAGEVPSTTVPTAPSSPSPPPSPPLVRGSLAVVVSSFADEVPLQLGFTAGLGFRVSSVHLRLSGTRYLPVELSSSLGSFDVARTAFAGGVGFGFVAGRFELEPEIGCEFEILRRSGASGARDVLASPAHSLYRVGPAVAVRLRYDLTAHLAVESLVGGSYLPQRIRFLVENPAATPLSEPWSPGFQGQLGLEVRVP